MSHAYLVYSSFPPPRLFATAEELAKYLNEHPGETFTVRTLEEVAA